MKKHLIILSLAALAVISATAQKTTKLTATKDNEYGLIYTLPLTEFKVTVAARKTVKTPGEFARYAEKYLADAPVLNPSVSYTITDVVVNPSAYADEDQRYLVTLKGSGSPSITITGSEFPVAVNDEEYTPETQLAALPAAVAPQPTILERPEAKRAVTPDMIQSKSSAKRAQLAAAKIYELRNVRNDIISGQADGMPSDGAAMKLALDQINSQEEALTAMFLGTEQTSVEVRTFTVPVPLEGQPTRSIFARLSQTAGLVSPDDLSGAPIYVSVTPLTTGELPLTDKGTPRTFPKGGLAYRIPGTAQVTVSYDNATLFDSTFEVAQYGVVFGLDPSLFTSKKSPSYLHFNPLTGSIRELGTIEE